MLFKEENCSPLLGSQGPHLDLFAYDQNGPCLSGPYFHGPYYCGPYSNDPYYASYGRGSYLFNNGNL